MGKMLEMSIRMQDDYYDCYDVMIITLCDYFGVEGNKSFCWRWGFNYAEQEDDKMVSLYDNMYVNRNQDTVCKLMQKYLGLELHGYHYEDIDCFESFVHEKINDDIPVGVVTDTFMCFWNPLYQKQSVKHCSLIIGYDDEFYYLKEPYFSVDTYTVKKYLFDEVLVKSVLDFYYTPTEEYDFWNMIAEGFDYVDCDHSKFNSMLRYSEDLCKLIEIDLQDDLSKKDVRYIPSLRSIKNLCSERKGLLELFKNHIDIVPCKVIQLLITCIEKWQICLTRLIRVYVTGRTTKLEGVSTLMAEIAGLEQQIFDETMIHIQTVNV